VNDDIENPIGESHRRPTVRVREGVRGEFGCTAWLKTRPEAEAFARAANEWIRKLEAAETEP
jgi:hypothetical protein